MTDLREYTSGNSGEFLEKLKLFSKDKLNQEEDIRRILEIVFREKEFEKLEDMAFNAKYVMGLMRIIQNRDNEIDAEYFGRIKSEYTQKIESIKGVLRALTGRSGGFIASIFEDKYFAMTQISLQNLNSLCEDLTRIKFYLNDLKKSKK